VKISEHWVALLGEFLSGQEFLVQREFKRVGEDLILVSV
jgi:hypothetical protein